MKRQMTSRLTAVDAVCQACTWAASSINALALAAIHHDSTGHPVTTTVTRVVQYGTEHDLNVARETAGQARLTL